MLKQFLRTSLLIPVLFISFSDKIAAKDLVKNRSINVEEIFNINSIKFNDIENYISENNFELRALKNMVKAASFNLSSSIGKRYPSLDLSASGLPQYTYSKNYNSTSTNTKSSQFKINPSLTIRWDLINPTRGPEIDSSRNNLKIAINNYEIKKNDLIQEAKSRYHAYQKSDAEAKNAKSLVTLSETILKDAKAKLEAGIGTKFDILEANAQLSRDIQLLDEKKIAREINELSLKEILNLKIEKNLEIKEKQKVFGFWNHDLQKNIQNGVNNSFSLKNLKLQRLLKNNQSKGFKNSNKPVIYISNTLSSSFSKGSTLTETIDPNQSGSNYSNTISLNFSWNLFDGNQNKNSSEAKESEAKADFYNYKNLENILKKNITETFLNLEKFEKKIISTQKEVISTTESLRLARLRYEVGISTLKDVLIRQKELSNAKSKNIHSIYNYNINLDQLERLTFQKMNNTCSENKTNQIDSICNFL